MCTQGYFTRWLPCIFRNLWQKAEAQSWDVQMNFTVTDWTQTTAAYSNSHHWNLMQTPQCFKYVASFSCGQHSGVLHPRRVLRSPAGLLVLHLFGAFCHWGWKSPCKSSYLAQLSTYLPFMDICFISCATSQIPPPLLHRLIFCVSELWIVVLPHCNKQMAARSWVITNPLREWLVPGRSALIRARWLLRVFVRALYVIFGASWHTVFAQVKWLLLPVESADWLRRAGVWRVKWHRVAPRRSKCVWLFETSWLLIQCVYTPKSPKCVSICVARVYQRPDQRA